MRGPVREAEDACAATTDGETVTVVPFHPLATFDGESEASNYTSRSPFPTIHLLRACDIERAEDTWYRLEEREDIRERQRRVFRGVGRKRVEAALGANRRERRADRRMNRRILGVLVLAATMSMPRY